jgi:hypothetical protein
METTAPFTFIKCAEPMSEDHELFNPEVEETIAKLGLPYNMAMAIRVSQAKISEERKEFYINEIKEKNKTIIEEQQELQRRFTEVCENISAQEQYEAEIKARQEQENVKVILPDTTENLTNKEEN